MVRCQVTVWIRFIKDEIEVVDLAFNSRMMPIYEFSNKLRVVNSMIEHILQQVENPALRNSKFVFNRVLYMDVNFHKLNLTRGSSYIPLPDWLAHKHAIINPKNYDNECFKWAIIAAIKCEEIGKDCQRISKLKQYEDEFNWSMVKFPTSMKGIGRFESNNEISVNVLAVDNNQIYICRKGAEYDRAANLMLITDGAKNHYVAVRSLSRLLSSQNSKHKESQHFCINCLQGFSSEESKDERYTYCRDNEAVRVEMPKKPIVEYCNGQYQHKVPFVIYVDFESILELIQGASNNPCISSTRGFNVHTPSGWCIYSKFAYGDVRNPCLQYRGVDCVETFCEQLISESKKLYQSFPQKPMVKLTKSQEKEYYDSRKCHICYKSFEDKDRKVRDHCHYTGMYRGAAHSSCNLQYKIPNYIPSWL